TPQAVADDPTAPLQDVVRLQFPGANTGGRVEGLDELPGRSNYFLGNDPAGWVSDVPNFAKVTYHDLFPGIDLVYHGADQQRLQFDFVVAPGADPGLIRLNWEGVAAVRPNPDGSLTLQTAHGEVVQRPPLLFQDTDGSRQAV